MLGVDTPLEAKRLTENVDAYECYLKGRHYRFVRYDAMQACRRYEEALTHEPRFAAAHAGVAEATTQEALMWILPPRQAAVKARAAAEEALRLNPNLSEAHEALAEIRFCFDWAWGDAEKEFQRALSLNPASVEAADAYGLCLAQTGRPHEALTVLAEARKRDPLSAYSLAITGLALWVANRTDDAIASCHQALALVPGFLMAAWYLSMIYATNGRYEEALDLLDQTPPPADQLALHLGILGWTHGLAGHDDAALRIETSLRERSRQEYITPIPLGYVLAGRGHIEESVAEFERAYQQRSPGLIFLQHPSAQTFGTDPRFPALLRRMNLPETAISVPRSDSPTSA